MSEHIYELKHPFEYAHKGDTQEASFITLFAPTFKQVGRMAPIKQAFTSAIEEVTKTVDTSQETGDAGDDNDKVTAAQVMQLMYRWSGDMTGVFLHAQELFKSGAALVDGETKLTTPLMEKMQMVDFEGLVGEYIANFIAPSLMDGQ